MFSCKKCLYNENHPFGLTKVGSICSGCFTHIEKDNLDWKDREKIFLNLINSQRSKKDFYDCVVPVIGDAEDFYTLSIVLKYGLRPLVVSVNDYFKNDIGWKNMQTLITKFDVDSIMYNPDIRGYKELVRASFRKYNHILLPFLQLHTSFPVHIAYERKIPLIIWGQNQAVEQVGKFSHVDSVEMSEWSRNEHDLFNIENKTLIGNGAQIEKRKLKYYDYPKINKLAKRNIKGIYLSNYFRWDPLYQNKESIKHGFQPELNDSTFDIYERAGSSVYYKIHDLLKFKRVGYRKVSDHVAREIRHNRLSTSEGKKIIKSYTSKKIEIRSFFEWLGVNETGYEWIKKYPLSDVQGLIEESSSSSGKIILPEKIDYMIQKGKKAKKDFILFGKEVFI